METHFVHSKKKLDIVIVGGGLVGSLEALYLAKRGHQVRLYELREDIRTTPQVRGRSINLALSVRGRRALKDVGLEDHMINNHGIPMTGRRIHRLDGSTYVIPYDARTKQVMGAVAVSLSGTAAVKDGQFHRAHGHVLFVPLLSFMKRNLGPISVYGS